MIDKSKLLLSDGEKQLMANTGWILTKRKIIDTITLLFGQLAEEMQQLISTQHKHLPDAVIHSTAKIAKGENYLQLPYVILDYPRCFDKEHIFAIRTMFWWGNFFSCSLQLSGKYKATFVELLQQNAVVIQQQNLYICINQDEWQHHFEADNYIAANAITEEKLQALLSQQHFIKVAAKFELHQWNEIDVLLEKSFSAMLQLLKN